MFEFLAFLTQIGFWEIVSTGILISGSVVGIRLLVGSTSHIPDLNFYITWTRNPPIPANRYPLTLDFEIRNLSHHFCVISTAYFRFDMAKPGSHAHGDSVSQQYEIKFRSNPDDTKSEIAALLRHRDIVTTYIPLDETQTDEELRELSRSRRFGTLYCDVVFIRQRPYTRRLKLNITGIVPNEATRYTNPDGHSHSKSL
jgi:hypothetical protein